MGQDPFGDRKYVDRILACLLPGTVSSYCQGTRGKSAQERQSTEARKIEIGKELRWMKPGLVLLC